MATKKTPRNKPDRTVKAEVEMRDEQLYKYPDAALKLSMSLNTLRARIREGKIAVVYTGKDGARSRKGRRISGAELRRFIGSNEMRTIAPAQ